MGDHGFLLDRVRFEDGLTEQAGERGAEILAPYRLQSAAYEDGQWELMIEGRGRECRLQADWVIDASGRQASFARRAGARSIYHDRLICHWLTGKGEEEHRYGGGYVQSVEHGWWYTAPLPEGDRVLAYFTDPGLPSMKNLSTSGFVQLACHTSHLGDFLQEMDFQPLQGLAKMAAHSASLSPCQGECWFAIGDASISFDPLSSRGLFHALYTGKLAAEMVLKSAQQGASQVRRIYQRQLEAILTTYLKHMQYYYQSETRWSHSPFWKGRADFLQQGEDVVSCRGSL